MVGDTRDKEMDSMPTDHIFDSTTVDDGSSITQSHARTIAVRIILYITGFILVLLAFRFVLPLLGANLNNAFANGIFQVTGPFVTPFSGLFRNVTVDRFVQFEPNTLVAMVVYALIAWGLVKLITVAR